MMSSRLMVNAIITHNPMIYAYTTPGIDYHEGWVKIGYTEGDPEKRIWQQTHTAGIRPIMCWKTPAMFTDEWKTFRDTDFHAYLRKKGIEQERGKEWFRIHPDIAK